MRLNYHIPSLLALAVLFLGGCESSTSSSEEASTDVSTLDSTWNKSLHYGKFVDSRDNSSYPTVTIGSQTWFAANLRYKPSGSDTGWAATDGRFYSWTAAKSACPTGWHLPTETELETLQDAVGDSTKLFAAKSLWGATSDLDKWGFHLVPTGTLNTTTNAVQELGTSASLWSATEDSSASTKAEALKFTASSIDWETPMKVSGRTVRCVKD